jgi:hypothetical protein
MSPNRIKKNLKIFRYDHGGSRIYLEDENGNSELIADTYQLEDREIIYNAILETLVNEI